ncbi:alpha/beta hydrolase [Virgisporangium ochraceum]|uniref:Hydrolase n=2 Tax=Virgisporangium ochraceum TaxID=65505 RepID=A0A8J3ZT93_9ACTN|nr:hydrolase [Virgisporangium ochraceum]
MIFAHGYGCDQNMWRFVAPAFADTHRIVLFDHIGYGLSNLDAYSVEKYSSLDAYALDVLDIIHELDLRDVTFVGHSVAAMIGALAVLREPGRFANLIMVGPSPRYIDDPDAGYTGGFSEADVAELLESVDSNYLGWSRVMAPVIMGNPERPELGEELTNSFCRTDPVVARQFAEVTFKSDNRTDLAGITVPTLVLQCSNDVIAPVSVGQYVHHHVANSKLVVMRATGHCPNLSSPGETVDAMKEFLGV